MLRRCPYGFGHGRAAVTRIKATTRPYSQPVRFGVENCGVAAIGAYQPCAGRSKFEVHHVTHGLDLAAVERCIVTLGTGIQSPLGDGCLAQPQGRDDDVAKAIQERRGIRQRTGKMPLIQP